MIQLKKWVSHRVLEVVYKLYVRPHLDYGDVLYHTPNPNIDIIFEPSKHSLLLKKLNKSNIELQKSSLEPGKTPLWKSYTKY